MRERAIRFEKLTMSAEDDLKLLRQILVARSVPTAPESFDNEEIAALFDELVNIRNVLAHFACGNFDDDINGRNTFAAALKSLQANLRHLVWQVKEVARGDFSQRVDFMGEFSEAFNGMARQLNKSITDLKERETSLLALTTDLKASEERWNLAVQCSRDGIWDINIDDQTAWYSDNFMQMMSYKPEHLPKDLHWETMIHPVDHAQAETLSTVLHGTGALLPFSETCRLRTGLGNYLWVQFRGMPVRSGNTRRLIAVVSDISEHKASEESWIHKALYDNLTGLPNRHLMNDRLKQAVANAGRHGHPFVFVTLDLDYFKEVNDTYGHAAGDQVLIELAQRLSRKLRPTDTAARLGGDEFVAIFPCKAGMEQTTAENVMERFYENLKPPVMLGDVEYQLRSSVGIAFFPKHAKDVKTLFEHADTALYKAKENGKNQYAIYDPN